MIQDFRNEVEQFLTSEVGQATLKGPLVLGIASGALLFSQVVHTASAHDYSECRSSDDCSSGERCVKVCKEKLYGTCIHEHKECRSNS